MTPLPSAISLEGNEVSFINSLTVSNKFMNTSIEQLFQLGQQKQNQRSLELAYNATQQSGVIMQTKAVKSVLAKNVKSLMATLGLSAQEVQRRSGGDVTGRMVGYILKEERAASIEIVEALGKAFKIKPALLLTDLSDNDIEHLTLISELNSEEKEEVKRYAAYLFDKREKNQT